MKKIKLNLEKLKSSKLQLSKETITNLVNDEMRGVFGGTGYTNAACGTGAGCNTVAPTCGAGGTGTGGGSYGGCGGTGQACHCSGNDSCLTDACFTTAC